MTDIIKTWPSFMEPRKVLAIFTHSWGSFYFSVGRGMPKQEIERIWYTHRGKIVGSFEVEELIKNETEATLPRLRSLSNQESRWQFRTGMWIARCRDFRPLKGRPLYYESFRGFRYFDLEAYRSEPASMIRV